MVKSLSLASSALRQRFAQLAAFLLVLAGVALLFRGDAGGVAKAAGLFTVMAGVVAFLISLREESRRRWMDLLAAALGVAGLVVALLSDKQATPGCVGTGCNGKDPEAAGCAERAGTVERRNVFGAQGRELGWVELRWSGRCQTNWARVENTSGIPNLRVTAELRDKNNKPLEGTAVEGRGLGTYGQMWYAPTGKVYVKACASINGNESCTDAH